jgi:hypothetical protein
MRVQIRVQIGALDKIRGRNNLPRHSHEQHLQLMSDTMYQLWCFIEKDNTYFCVVASSTISVNELKKLIKEERSDRIRVDAASLTLSKVRYF